MKILSFLFIFHVNSLLLLSQVGISTSPTRMLDVNGEVHVQTLPNILMPNVPFVLVTDANGVLSEATPLEMMYSSGLFVDSRTNNNWNNLYTGTKACLIDFTGRIADDGTDFNFRLFYKNGMGFKVISQKNLIVNPIDGTSFKIDYGSVSYTFKFTTNESLTNVRATKTTGGNAWSQGTFKILPIF